MKAKQRLYRVLSAHSENLGDGRVVAPGSDVMIDEASLKDPITSSLIARGRLYELPTPEPVKKTKTKKKHDDSEEATK